MSSLRGPLLASVLLTLLALGAGRPAQAHTPPPIYISVSVDEEQVVWELTVAAGIFEDWLPLEAAELNDLEGEALAQARTQIEAFVREWGAVKIDGLEVEGRLGSARYEAFTDHEIQWDYVQVRMLYETKGMPRDVALVWRNFNGGLGGFFSSVESEIVGGGETDYYVFRESEPEVVWHAPRASSVRPIPELPRARGPRPLTVPWMTLGLLGLAVLGWFALRRRAAPGTALAAFAVVGLGLGLGFSGVALGQVALPWAHGVERPSDAEAAEIFESLLRNIYRAFDFDDEDRIYDTLARSVTGDLLDHLYLEVNGSLIMQEAGGAVSKVQKVEIEEVTLLTEKPDQGSWFDLEARWRVQGKVGHWGHTHVRLNGYKARFTVTEVDGGWKIADMEILAQERLDDGSMGRR